MQDIMEKKLSIKKSIKKLKDIFVWSMMIIWILFLTILLSNKAKAQTLQSGHSVEYIDIDCTRNHGTLLMEAAKYNQYLIVKYLVFFIYFLQPFV